MKKIIFLSCLCLISKVWASTEFNEPGIHHSTAISSWCGNIALSTKVGHWQGDHCVYEKETRAYGIDTCGPYHLNGYRLEMNAGAGFDCACTHMHSNVLNTDACDPFKLLSNSEGHYFATEPDTGIAELK